MAKAPDNLYVVITAGGVGSRLWPKSRKILPKQFFHLENKTSLVQLTYKRLQNFIPNKRIYIAAPAYYKDLIKKQLPNIPSQNYIFDPKKHGTTAINLLSAALIYSRDPQAIIHLLVADDYLSDKLRFQQTSTLAALLAQQNSSAVIFGVKPHSAHTGFGYIKVGESIKTQNKIQAYKVIKFIEKPDEKTARRYIRSNKYFWHGSGITASAKVILSAIAKYPNHKQIVNKIIKYIQSGKSLNSARFIRLYSQITTKPIEKTFLEQTTSISMLTLESGWNDIGSWSQVYEIFKKDKDGNVILGNKNQVVLRNCNHNIIFANKRLITLTDTHAMIVIDTADALLVCPMANAQNVKKIVEILKEKKLTQYL